MLGSQEVAPRLSSHVVGTASVRPCEEVAVLAVEASPCCVSVSQNAALVWIFTEVVMACHEVARCVPDRDQVWCRCGVQLSYGPGVLVGVLLLPINLDGPVARPLCRNVCNGHGLVGVGSPANLLVRPAPRPLIHDPPTGWHIGVRCTHVCARCMHVCCTCCWPIVRGGPVGLGGGGDGSGLRVSVLGGPLWRLALAICLLACVVALALAWATSILGLVGLGGALGYVGLARIAGGVLDRKSVV